MNVRYYADADIQELHDHTLRLLKTLHDEHGITVESTVSINNMNRSRISLATYAIHHPRRSTSVISSGIGI